MAYELSRVIFTCPAGALIGDAVYISGVKTVSYADVDDSAKYPNAVIMDKITATTCFLSGRNSVIAGLAGLTAGSYYYLTGTATAGNTISLVASAFIVALAISTTELRIELDAVIATHVAAANPHAGSAPTAHSHLDGEVDNGITLTNITQITTRSHTSLTDIGLTAHGGIDTHIGAANPHTGAQPLDDQLTSLAAFTADEITQLSNIGASTITAGQWGIVGGLVAIGSGTIISVAERTALHARYALTEDLAAGEITQLQAIGAVTITLAQWGYLGDTNQALTTAALTTLAEGVITAEIVGGQSIDNAIDALIATHVLVATAHHTKYALTDDLAAGEITQLQAIGATTISLAQWGYVGAMNQGVTTALLTTLIEGIITAEIVGGQSIDNAIDTLIGNHQGVAGSHHAKYALTDDLAAGEITQLQAIGAVTITVGQWGYLGGSDQNVRQADSPTFVGLTLTGAIATPTNISMSGELDLTGTGACIDLNPSGTGAKTIIELTPSAAIGGVAWWGFFIDGGALDPSAGGAQVLGLYVDFTGVSLANDPDVWGIIVSLPATYASGDEFAGLFSGDGKTVYLCDDTYALYVDLGDAQFDGSVGISGSITSLTNITMTGTLSGVTALSMTQQLDLTGNVSIDINTSASGTVSIVDIVPTAALDPAAVWKGFYLGGGALDPTNTNVDLYGMHIDFTGTSLANDPDIYGVYIQLPASYAAGTEIAGYFAGDSKVVQLCNDTYGLEVTGTSYLNGAITTQNSNNLGSLTTAEVTQLMLIGATTISAAQWGYLGATSESIQTHMSAANPHSGSLANIVEDTTPQLGGELDFNNKAMNLNATTVNDNTAVGIIINMTAGVQLDFPEVVCIDASGDAVLADADSSNTMPVIGMALETKNATETIKILIYGFVYRSAWAWAVGGAGETRLLYASVTPGAMSQTPPVGSADQAQVVATVVEVDRIIFNPSYVLVEIA